MNGSGGGRDDGWDRRAWSRQGPDEPPPPPLRPQQAHPDQQFGHPPPGYDWATDATPRSGGGAGVAVAVGVVVLLVLALIVAVVILVVRSGGDAGVGGAGAPVAGEEMVTVTSTAPPETGASPGSETSPPTTATTTATTRASAPSGLVEECIDEGDTALPRAGRGTEVTSCAFAIAVREAYLSTAPPGDPAAVEARSPVTGQTYSMGCLGGEVVTCRGGNDAVVYLY